MEDELRFLKSKIKNEGIDYTFLSYSSWKEIKDEKFHELRQKYEHIAKQLEQKVYQMLENLDEEDLELEENLQYLKFKLEDEGLDYCFRYASSWEEIQDNEFSKLNKEYNQIADELEKYIDDLYYKYAIGDIDDDEG